MTVTQIALALGPVAFAATLGLVIFAIKEAIRTRPNLTSENASKPQ